VYAEGDVASALRDAVELDRAATEALVARLLPGLEVVVVEDGNLGWNINPPDGVVYAGVFPGLTVICAAELGELRPSFLRPGWLADGAGRRVILHSMHSVITASSRIAVTGCRSSRRTGPGGIPSPSTTMTLTTSRIRCRSIHWSSVRTRWVIVDMGGEHYIQAAAGGYCEIPAGVFWVERREGGPDRHFRCEVDTVEEVAEIFRGYLVNQDGRGDRVWEQIWL
jgi:hypothetical protein